MERLGRQRVARVRQDDESSLLEPGRQLRAKNHRTPDALERRQEPRVQTLSRPKQEAEGLLRAARPVVGQRSAFRQAAVGFGLSPAEVGFGSALGGGGVRIPGIQGELPQVAPAAAPHGS
jgi:hypothetical protein